MRRLLRSRWLGAAAAGLALLSLALNLYLLSSFRYPERWAAPLVQRVLRQLAADDARLRYEVRLPAGTPLSLDIPVNERFTIGIDTVIPVRTTILLPIRSPLGSHTVRVPVRANVPLRTRLPLRVRHTFRLRTATREEIAIPLEIGIRDLPLADIERALEAVGDDR